MIKDHNLVPNQEARLGYIHQKKLQAIVWRDKGRHRHGLKIIVDV